MAREKLVLALQEASSKGREGVERSEYTFLVVRVTIRDCKRLSGCEHGSRGVVEDRDQGNAASREVRAVETKPRGVAVAALVVDRYVAPNGSVDERRHNKKTDSSYKCDHA